MRDRKISEMTDEELRELMKKRREDGQRCNP